MSINKHFVVRKGLVVNATSANVVAEFKSNDAIFVPEGTTGERPASPANGYFRYNTTEAEFEGYAAGAWGAVGGGATVTTSASAPGTPSIGDFWYDTDVDIMYMWSNTGATEEWVDLITDPANPVFTASASVPSTPSHIDFWFDTGDDILSVYVNDGQNDVWMDILTAGTVENNYISASYNQTFTNTQTSQARNNMSAAHIMALASQNLIINGNMEISQENGNAASNVAAYYPVDQWQLSLSGGPSINTHQSDTGINNFDKSIDITVKTTNAVPSTTSFQIMGQNIEGTFTKKLGWGTTAAQPVTYGFWATSNQIMTFCTSLRNADLNRTYIVEHTFDAADTWQWFTGVVDGPTSGTWYSNSSIGIRYTITVGAGATYQNTASSWLNADDVCTSGTTNFGGFGAGNTFLFTGVTLLPGEHTISSDESYYLQRPYDEELRKCQRYFEVIADGSANTVARLPMCGFFADANSAYFPFQFMQLKKDDTYTLSINGDLRLEHAGGTSTVDSGWSALAPTNQGFLGRANSTASATAGDGCTARINSNSTYYFHVVGRL